MITGIDKSGKSTLVDALNKKTNYEHYVIERCPTTVRHFAELLRRPFDEVRFHQLCQSLNTNSVLHVCLFAEDWLIKERFIEANESPLPGDLTFHEHQNHIMMAFTRANWQHRLFLNTGRLSINVCVNIILKKLKEMKNAY